MFDVVLANLPYVPSAEIAGLPVAASFEPRTALDGGPDGLEVIRRLLDQLPRRLADRGVALVEIGTPQVDAVRTEVAHRLPSWSVALHADLAGQPRVAELAAARATR
jgi:release factor glutamine methyltransferase